VGRGKHFSRAPLPAPHPTCATAQAGQAAPAAHNVLAASSSSRPPWREQACALRPLHGSLARRKPPRLLDIVPPRARACLIIRTRPSARNARQLISNVALRGSSCVVLSGCTPPRERGRVRQPWRMLRLLITSIVLSCGSSGWRSKKCVAMWRPPYDFAR